MLKHDLKDCKCFGSCVSWGNFSLLHVGGPSHPDGRGNPEGGNFNCGRMVSKKLYVKLLFLLVSLPKPYHCSWMCSEYCESASYIFVVIFVFLIAWMYSMKSSGDSFTFPASGISLLDRVFTVIYWQYLSVLFKLCIMHRHLKCTASAF